MSLSSTGIIPICEQHRNGCGVVVQCSLVASDGSHLCFTSVLPPLFRGAGAVLPEATCELGPETEMSLKNCIKRRDGVSLNFDQSCSLTRGTRSRTGVSCSGCHCGTRNICGNAAQAGCWAW